ncbi:helix-turn-helix domain-containing protein [Anaeromyxobacter dehalogenans]|uniref:Transcriptional regulator, XRE family n=1 Tax=Anaeromyxobacter dehalogenans (strain 2CP-C) TaxID=290397 RepID=Q2IMU3_ANADE|nr:helix-turn-helix transcriptional regulator [Anaeromyxobacter dehalogenans]ABC80125.1 transcriptional regulator, XRE family [Anaeromyxobacter dehalogenans 2CP-C]
MHAPPAPTAPAGVGPLLRAWRTARGKSQLALALEAGVSSRHLSYLENGRSTPSREMVLDLAEVLGVPLRERNALLQAAGYAAVFRETPLDAPDLAEVRRALLHVLEASEPNPALLVNRRYDVLLANGAAVQLISHFAPAWRGRNNVALMLVSPDGLRPSVENWAEVAGHVLHRMRDELSAMAARDPDDERLLRVALEAEPELRAAPGASPGPAILVPIRLRRGDLSLDLFTTITTVGTPLDITLQELRIETLFPASAAAREALARVREAAEREEDAG